MDNVRIITNNHARELVSFEQLPESARSDFDYVTGEDQWSPRFVQYRGSWYDTSDCDGLASNVGITGWDLYASDSFFSGVLFRWPDIDGSIDYESVVVGLYLA
jgi:hypothetical protein